VAGSGIKSVEPSSFAARQFLFRLNRLIYHTLPHGPHIKRRVQLLKAVISLRSATKFYKQELGGLNRHADIKVIS
jgi:hypothetical protein